MESFKMCVNCSDEYHNVSDRRFHAQPVACNECGPVYMLHSKTHKTVTLSEILEEVNNILRNDGILALKGIGGFHLMCDALNNSAVERLRHQKRHEGKPFAVMFRDMESVRKFAEVSEEEEVSLTSWRKPIVLLRSKKNLANAVQLGLNTIGAFLPYMPFHYLMFKVLDTPAVVLTSGNLADEPIVTSNDKALLDFDGIADAVITYNREIYNRTDDSVVRIINSKERIIRRSRGYAPSPLRPGFNVDGILAAGAELSNTFCIGKGDRAYLSQHIGDLKNHETFQFFEETQLRYRKLFRTEPSLVAADLHPDYLSTRFASRTGLPVIQIQHHHAHIASCMAENGVDEPVIGVAFDGTGYGTDGNIWGSEFLVCDFQDHKRYLHFNYMPLPGGDKAAEEPWRMGVSLLHQTFGKDLLELNLPIIKELDRRSLEAVIESITKGINCHLTSGAGRLFDGVAAITGVCIKSLFHAEAPVRLESVLIEGVRESYPFDINGTIDFRPAIRAIYADMQYGLSTGIISARFHNTIAEASYQAVNIIREQTGISLVALSGGTFQNKYLAEMLESMLVKNNFVVLTHSKVPCNDGGIALGQMAIAGRKFENLKM